MALSKSFNAFSIMRSSATPVVCRLSGSDTALGGGSYLLPAFEAAARSLKVEPIKAPAHNDTEIEMVIASLGREPGGGLVVMPDGFMLGHRAQIVSLAARHHLAVVYNQAMYVRGRFTIL